MDQETLNVVTLIIATLGLVLAVVSLVWQVVAWSFTGSRIVVQTRYAYGVVERQLQGKYASITARNVGRTAASITGWGLQLPGDESVVSMSPSPMNTPVPVTLEPGHEQSWYLYLPDIQETLRSSGGGNVEVPGFVNVGTGRRVLSKEKIKI